MLDVVNRVNLIRAIRPQNVRGMDHRLDHRLELFLTPPSPQIGDTPQIEIGETPPPKLKCIT